MKYYPSFIILLLVFGYSSYAQEIIYLSNPSYEDIRRHSHVAETWGYCNVENQSPPDTQPGFFNVSKPAFEGNSYCSLVTREDGTNEILVKPLEQILEKGQCYQLVFHIAQSHRFRSIVMPSLEDTLFIAPIQLEIYGNKGNSCEETQLLAELEKVEKQDDWLKCTLYIQPEENYKTLLFIIKPMDGEKPTNGHILLDYFYPIIPVDCESKEPIVKIPTEEELKATIGEKRRIYKLTKKANLDQLERKGHLPYQLYFDGEGTLRYNHIYLDLLFEEITKEDKRLLIVTPSKFSMPVRYLQEYFARKGYIGKILFQSSNQKTRKLFDKGYFNIYYSEGNLCLYSLDMKTLKKFGFIEE